jgi:hypothetical protein
MKVFLGDIHKVKIIHLKKTYTLEHIISFVNYNKMKVFLGDIHKVKIIHLKKTYTLEHMSLDIMHITN